jgi:hypothetical protein
MALGPLVLGDGFTCSVCSNPQQHGSSISIRSGVGDWPPPRCQNYKDDVAKIQAALNRFSPAEGGPTPPLKEDGIIGPKTKAAIYQFQRKWNLTPDNSDKADGVVDVKGYTLQRLSGGPGRPIDLPTEFTTRIPRALEIITATRAAIMLARNYFRLPNNGGPLPPLNSIGKQQADRLDRHFRIRQTANPVRRINEIEAIYLNMQRAVGHMPVNFIVEEPANIATGAYMAVFYGGFYRRNQTISGMDWTRVSYTFVQEPVRLEGKRSLIPLSTSWRIMSVLWLKALGSMTMLTIIGIRQNSSA